MKISLISTPLLDTPPKTYGGLERVCFDLANGLINRGHKVVLFTTDDSQVPKGGFLYKTGKAKGTVNTNWIEAERDMWKIYDSCLNDFDLTHAHNWFGFEYASKKKNPNLKITHTHHGGLNMAYWGKSRPPFKLNLMGISSWMKRVYESQGFPAQVCYNGVDLDIYPYQKNKGDRLMFLGRIDTIKAPHVALEVAKKTSIGLDVVGGTSFVSDPTYVTKVEKQCDGTIIKFIGEVDHQTKLRYLQNAKALLIPSQFGEPFGLICVEAMACGTVPIARRDGALEEIIEQGKSGFICDSMEEMVDAISKIGTISPADCRKRAELFSKERMAERYEQLYKTILEGIEW